MYHAKAFEIIAEDKTSLSATIHFHQKKSRHLIIMCPATGAPQHYYKGFAEYASQYKDFDVLTFDYRGTGKSLKGNIKDNQSVMSDYGRLDLQAILRWASPKYQEICLIGHSVAGQIFPKAKGHERIKAAYFVGSQSAYHGHWKGFWWIYVLIFWYILIPVTTFFSGYLPGWAMGGKVPLPKKVALEWRKWGTHKEGVIQGSAETEREFASVRIPVHFVSIEDDNLLAPSAATQALMHCYKNAVTTYQYIRPRDLKLAKIGHFGFFRKEASRQLWPMPILFFSQFVNKLEENSR